MMMLHRPQPVTNAFYTTYDHRLLPGHDEEDEIQTTKCEIKSIKKDTVSSTQNAIRIAAQAEATGVDILERLGYQQEKLLNVEENLEEVSIEMQVAGEKVRKIKRLRRSLWGSIFRNPLAMIRRARRIQKIEERRIRLAEAKRERREGGKAAEDTQHQQPPVAMRNDSIGDGMITPPKPQGHPERMRYQFEADSEDEEVENEIDQNIEYLYGTTIRLKNLGVAIGQELDSQNILARRIVVNIDETEDEVALNSHRQDRLRRK